MASDSANKPPFDPYHEWLGIPADRQPPSPYRLLAVSPFERDVEVLETAGRIRVAFLERHRSGPQATQAKQLIGEVQAAVDELLDPATRQRCEARWCAEWRVAGDALLPFDFGSSRDGEIAVADPRPAHLRGASETTDGSAAMNVASAGPTAPLPPHLTSASSDRVAGAPPLTSYEQMSPPQLSTSQLSTSQAAAPYARLAPPAVPMTDVQGALGPGNTAGGFAGPTVRGARKRSTAGRWLAALMIGLMFLPIHALLGWIGWKLATREPSSRSSSSTLPESEAAAEVLAGDRPAMPTPAVGKALQFAPGNSLVWENVSSWWKQPTSGTIEVWVTMPRSIGFSPLFGVYSGPVVEEPTREPASIPAVSPATNSDEADLDEADQEVTEATEPATPSASETSAVASGWRGWVLGWERRASEETQYLVIRRCAEGTVEVQRWPIPANLIGEGPYHVALVVQSGRATMFCNGVEIGSAVAAAVVGQEPADAALWIGSGAPLRTVGAWRGMLLELRVSRVARDFKRQPPQAGWETDVQTVLLLERNVRSVAESQSVMDRSGRDHRGRLQGARWADYRP